MKVFVLLKGFLYLQIFYRTAGALIWQQLNQAKDSR